MTSTEEPSRSVRPADREPNRLLPVSVHLGVAAVVAAVVFAAVVLAMWWAGGLPDLISEEPDVLDAKAKLELIKVGLAVVAGVGGLVALVVAYRRQRVHEQENHRANQAEQREKTKLFNERFGAATAQLGHEKAAVRLAGVYALTGLADDWEEQRQTCIDVLCAYLRMPYMSPDAKPSAHSGGQPGGGELDQSGPTAPDPWSEREVRVTIIRLVASHLRDEAIHSWCGHDFDFTGAVFDRGDFSDARFNGGKVSFSGAEFPGGVSFDNSWFAAGEVSFEGARFPGGRVTFDGSLFTGGKVSFDGVKFIGGAVYFTGAEFAGGDVSFNHAEFVGGSVYFTGAEFKGAQVAFDGARFTPGWAKFDDSRFTGGVVSFNGAEVTGRGVSISFDGAEFSGGTVAFTGAQFSSGQITFFRAAFTGSHVNFDEARFSGADVFFTTALFTGGRVDLARVLDFTAPPMFERWARQPPSLILPLDPDSAGSGQVSSDGAEIDKDI